MFFNKLFLVLNIFSGDLYFYNSIFVSIKKISEYILIYHNLSLIYKLIKVSILFIMFKLSPEARNMIIESYITQWDNNSVTCIMLNITFRF